MPIVERMNGLMLGIMEGNVLGVAAHIDAITRKTRPGLRSQLTIGTAGKIDLGRAKEIHLLHCSESPYWPDPEATELSLLNCVPDLPSNCLAAKQLWSSASAREPEEFLAHAVVVRT